MTRIHLAIIIVLTIIVSALLANVIIAKNERDLNQNETRSLILCLTATDNFAAYSECVATERSKRVEDLLQN